MHFPSQLVRIAFVLVLICAITVGQVATQKQQDVDDVVRVNSELVQTDVMVFDRRGNFIDGLNPDQFVVTLNGAKRPVQFLSRVSAGSSTEAEQITAARSGKSKSSATPVVDASTTSRSGRLIYFFVDDIHLNPESLERSRKSLLNFVDNRLNPEDQVAIVSSSGQIGFLQQLTDNQTVLHAAIERLNYRKNPETTAGRTRISEYMASQVGDAGNRELFAYLMDSVKIEFGMGIGALRGSHSNDSAGQASRMLKSRISQINAQSRIDAFNTLRALQGVIESSSAVPGRKLVFLLSDGFVVDPRGSSTMDLLHQVTKIAARAGAVIYTMDTRGNFLDSSVDASNNDFVDMTSRHAGISLGESMGPREPLSIMAAETGGRAIFNSSSIENAIRQSVDETSEYYVVGWRPDADNERNGTARMEITVAGRPELKVRLRKSYLSSAPSTSTKEGNKTPATPEAQLLAALGTAYPKRNIPTSLSVGYTKSSTGGFTLQAAMQVQRSSLNLLTDVREQKRELDVIGAAIDDRGLIYSFKQVLTVLPQTKPTPVIWTQQLAVQPGLYQVRVAVRDRTTGLTGSAVQWIEIPSMSKNRYLLSSLFLGEREVETEDENKRGPHSIRVDVDHRFKRNSVLRFQTYVYNVVSNQSSFDILIEANVLRGREEVLRLKQQRVPSEAAKDPTSLPYWSEISLSELSPGHYTLQVAAVDRSGNRLASQRTNFVVD
jgi:VWFA-related protein